MLTLRRWMQKPVHYLRNTRAVSALEYAILVGTIAVAMATAIANFGSTITAALGTIGSQVAATKQTTVGTIGN